MNRQEESILRKEKSNTIIVKNIIEYINLYFKKENMMSHEEQVKICSSEELVQCKIEWGRAYEKAI